MSIEAVNQVLELIKQTRGKFHGQLVPEELVALATLEKSLEQCRPLFERPLPEYPLTLEDEEEPAGRVTGPFSRLAKGGVIYGEDAEVFMPEIWVRNLGVEHGDWLAADPLGMLQDNMLYEFTVLERRNQPDRSKRVAVIAPLLYHAGEWMIYSEEEQTTLTLNPKEVRSLGLREGDLIEVAYLEGDIARARIAWKFEEQTLEERREVKARREEKPRPTVDVADPLLAGRKVLVVGADLYKEAFRRMFERRGAHFDWESGFQGGLGKNIESKVRGNDIVVIVTEMMSHRLPDVEAMCRRHKKPYVYAPSKGSTGAIREVQKKLGALQPLKR